RGCHALHTRMALRVADRRRRLAMLSAVQTLDARTRRLVAHRSAAAASGIARRGRPTGSAHCAARAHAPRTAHARATAPGAPAAAAARRAITRAPAAGRVAGAGVATAALASGARRATRVRRAAGDPPARLELVTPAARRQAQAQ